MCDVAVKTKIVCFFAWDILLEILQIQYAVQSCCYIYI